VPRVIGGVQPRLHPQVGDGDLGAPDRRPRSQRQLAARLVDQGMHGYVRQHVRDPSPRERASRIRSRLLDQCPAERTRAGVVRQLGQQRVGAGKVAHVRTQRAVQKGVARRGARLERGRDRGVLPLAVHGPGKEKVQRGTRSPVDRPAHHHHPPGAPLARDAVTVVHPSCSIRVSRPLARRAQGPLPVRKRPPCAAHVTELLFRSRSRRRRSSIGRRARRVSRRA
jgi:hypothetical protein